MASFAKCFMETFEPGHKLRVGKIEKPILSKEEAICKLRRPTVLYYEGGSGYGMRNARYVFDFSKNEWEKELEITPDSKQTGKIPDGLAEAFLEMVWPICNFPESVYKTESQRYVSASDEERYTLQSDTKRLTWFRSLIFTKMFEWIAETDTSEPYCILTKAYSDLLTGLDI